MERVAQVLQLAVKVQRRRAFSVGGQTLQKGRFLLAQVSAPFRLLQKCCETWLHGWSGWAGFCFPEFELLAVTVGQPAIQDDFQAEAVEFDIPVLEEGSEKRQAVLGRDMEDTGIQEVEDEKTRRFRPSFSPPGE